MPEARGFTAPSGNLNQLRSVPVESGHRVRQMGGRGLPVATLLRRLEGREVDGEHDAPRGVLTAKAPMDRLADRPVLLRG